MTEEGDYEAAGFELEGEITIIKEDGTTVVIDVVDDDDAVAEELFLRPIR